MDDQRTDRERGNSIARLFRLVLLMAIGGAVGCFVGEKVNYRIVRTSWVYDRPLWVSRDSAAIFIGAICGLVAELLVRLFASRKNAPWGFRFRELLFAMTIAAIALVAFLAVWRY